MLGAYAHAFHFNPLEEDETFSDDELDDLTEGVMVVHFSDDDKACLRGRRLSLLSSNPLVGMWFFISYKIRYWLYGN